jgi:hexosaminidase
MILPKPKLSSCLLAMSMILPITYTASARAQGPELPLMPMPSHVTMGPGSFLVDGSFNVELDGYKEPRLERARQRFLETLTRETGIPIDREAQQNAPHFFIKTGGASKPVQELGEDESYHLTVTPTEVHLEAPNPLGILHGLQTFVQLVTITPDGFRAQAVTIDDQPRFPWRGLMLDAGRHFMPLDVVRRDLDGMEAVKLNVFHWHLSEDQGFRVESKKYPLLTEKGSDGFYYTQDEIRGIIDYARDRGIRVVPEFDMPGHATSWFVGYPDLSSGPGPYQIERKFGVFDPAMDPTRDSTYKFLDGFIGEMTALFPDAYFHIGGDESNGKQWDRNAKIQEFMKAHGIKDNAALQSYFTSKVQKLVAKHGKITEGWDEVLQPDTPKDVVIQSWRGQDSLAAAARQGNKGLLSNGYYIDLNQPTVEHYLVDPMDKAAASLSPEQKKLILGGEATMWSEFTTPEIVDSRIWPRTAAIAERFWSPQDVRDVPSMYARMGEVSTKLEYYGLEYRATYYRMLQRMIGLADPTPLRVLGDVVAPPKGYERESLKEYTSFSPLNHLVDAVPPESETARRFAVIVDHILAKTATPEEWEQADQWLTLWRDNDATLQPLLERSEITKELVPVSENLRKVADAGLTALNNLKNHQSAGADWRSKQLEMVKAAEKPQAVVVNMVAPSVEKLVEAAQ